MRRILIVAIVAVGVAGVWWLAEDGGLQHRLGEIGGDVMEQVSGKPAPSWGDVADRVGDFAREESELKKTVGGLGGGLPADGGDPAAKLPASEALAKPE
ncbi:MAG: hypothetical protein KDJ86_11980 [Bauldia sp.]|uniref:hypothetical protein n=1 Tax=Bauldia sp. TaxID=2575872 RepID=UPI001D450619|nr:hypothetical protein [Bauldia sp.]MCB1496499.1 hypothetical protein [Bauldia sp.]